MLGAIFIACITAYLHNRFYDTEIPEWLGIFKDRPSSSPSALLRCRQPFSSAISGRPFSTVSNNSILPQDQRHLRRLGYTFAEKILLPAGLHHFIYLPFIYGPAVVDNNGIQAYWLQHLNDFATSAQSLRTCSPGWFCPSRQREGLRSAQRPLPCTTAPN